MRKLLTFLLVGSTTAAVFAAVVYDLTTIPIVHMSFSEQSCKEVDDPSGQYNCENIPPRYTTIWVK